MRQQYLDQVRLLIEMLPLIMREKEFAVKGGTAINFFIRDIPRLSVDIDLVYLPIQDRAATLEAISNGLKRVKGRIVSQGRELIVKEKRITGDHIVSLYVTKGNRAVKIEANTIFRGSVFSSGEREVSTALSERFAINLFAEARTLSVPDLYGSKICAALDRQHPRDLFDIKVLFEYEGITGEIMKAFVVYCACHDRPMHELLAPNRSDMRPAFENEFAGMTDRPVTCEELEAVRERLVSEIQNGLTPAQKNFLVSMKQGEPMWDLLGLPGIERLPALQWKCANIRAMDKAKQADMLEKLKAVLKT
ncbi:MAG: nucleotidyl transferase AbiEii/AbiGii toxin family protein [Chitinispirillaceae bacterium]|jgi:predicted nucleotidyltransferase component of viral defense system